MPEPTDGPVLTFAPAAPAWGETFLARVASALSVSPDGHGLLVERRSDWPHPFLVPLRPEVAREIARIATVLPGRLRSRRSLPMRAELEGAEERWAVVVGGSPVEGDEPSHDRRRRSATGSRTVEIGRRSAPPMHAPGVSGLPWSSVQAYWFPDPRGPLRVWVRIRVADRPHRVDASLLGTGLPIAQVLSRHGATPVRLEERDGRWWTRWEWDAARLGRLRPAAPLLLDPELAAAAVPGPPLLPFPTAATLSHHTVVVGASGSGKTTLLARLAADRIAAGGCAVVFDVHGDLAPRVLAVVPPERRGRVVAIDAARPSERIVGVSVLGSGDDRSEGEASDLVAALKRLSVDGSETYWGFRLERLFDTFVRLVQEEGGSLVDLADVLTDPRRREAARWSTRRPEIARFLEELPAIERRAPEFLWPAAARLSKVTLVPRLAALLAPPGGGVRIAPWVAGGGSLLFRLPFRDLGPEGSAFAATLLATRTYLSLAREESALARPSILLVFDEAHALSPRLLTEILSEGRKFGIGAVVATQYPDRLAPELRAAAAGSAGSHVIFRVPAAAARATGGWVGLEPSDAERVLPLLPSGQAVVTTPDGDRRIVGFRPGPVESEVDWRSATDRSFEDHGESEPVGTLGSEIEERILLAVFDLGRRAAPVEIGSIVEWMRGPGVPVVDGEMTRTVVAALGRRGWLRLDGGQVELAPAGAHRLGVGASTGAPSESAEHRALLLEALRIFARHGLQVDLVRQGRFDTRLPDGIVRIAPEPVGRISPGERYELLGACARTWGWNFFGGRNVHLEAEVSGALRTDRILRGLDKADRAGCRVLFLVADSRRARRVKDVLRNASAFPERAHVWTLPRAQRRTPEGRFHRG